jgi:hypothetical protein
MHADKDTNVEVNPTADGRHDVAPVAGSRSRQTVQQNPQRHFVQVPRCWRRRGEEKANVCCVNERQKEREIAESMNKVELN